MPSHVARRNLLAARPDLDIGPLRGNVDTRLRKLAEVMPQADVFLGLSAAGVLKPEMYRA